MEGAENTVKTDTGKLIHIKYISQPITFQTEKAKKRDEIMAEQEITPKYRHKLKGIDGKYSKWKRCSKSHTGGQAQNYTGPKEETERFGNRGQRR